MDLDEKIEGAGADNYTYDLELHIKQLQAELDALKARSKADSARENRNTGSQAQITGWIGRI